MKKAIMVVGAHGDDIEIRAGGTLAKYTAEGYKGYYVQTTRSNSGFNCLKDGGSYDYSEKIATMRLKEMQAAADVFGAELLLMDFKEHMYTMADGTHLYPDIREFPEIKGKAVSGREPIVVACRIQEYVDELADRMVEAEPEIVITHAPDMNPDHYCTMLLTYQAFEAAAMRVSLGALHVRTYGREIVGALGIQPDLLVDVSDYAEVAAEAINKHVSQCLKTDRVKGLKRAWKEFAHCVEGAKYVEAFRRIRSGEDA